MCGLDAVHLHNRKVRVGWILEHETCQTLLFLFGCPKKRALRNSFLMMHIVDPIWLLLWKSSFPRCLDDFHVHNRKVQPKWIPEHETCQALLALIEQTMNLISRNSVSGLSVIDPIWLLLRKMIISRLSWWNSCSQSKRANQMDFRAWNLSGIAGTLWVHNGSSL